MSKTNSRLKTIVDSRKPQVNLVAAINTPAPDSVNIQGLPAYAQDKFLKLLTMLNTLKLQNQYYRTEVETLTVLQNLIEECAKEDLYLTCQCIVYSRCLGEGMRTISHAASVFIAPHLSGAEFGKRFYGSWDRQNGRGGVIYRPDDMSKILSGFVALNGIPVETVTIDLDTDVATSEFSTTGTKLTNAMKKGFKAALESMDSYSLLKYKSKLIDVINLVHPSGEKSGAVVKYEDNDVYTLDAIMRGYNVSADTWEVNQGNAGQIVAQAVKEGKLSTEEAKVVLQEAKAENWNELLTNNKLGILACFRNLRNILLSNPTKETVFMVCQLVSSPELIRKGKIMPYQIDLANDVMVSEFSTPESRSISMALAKGYESSIPNLAFMLEGRNVVMLDQSGSMSIRVNLPNGRQGMTCSSKAALICATIAKATNADIIVFGSSAKYVAYSPLVDVFTLAKQLDSSNMGGTDLSSAWSAAAKSGSKYDRVFILSDNECNRGNTYTRYQDYLRQVSDPYVYSVDLAGYGSTPIAGPKVRYYYGYGHAMFDDIANVEYNASYHIDKVKKVII